MENQYHRPRRDLASLSMFDALLAPVIMFYYRE